MARKKSILLNVRPYQTRMAYVEGRVIKDLFYHQDENPSLVGGIYKGKVVRSSKGVNFVFIDLGLKRSGFLYRRKNSHRSQFEKGEALLVQIISDPIYSKGSRLTADISLSSRLLVYLPQGENKVTVSRRILSEKERTKLANEVKKFNEPGTFIVRTLAEGQSAKDLKKDFLQLKTEWKSLQKKFKQKKDVGEIQKGLNPELSYLKDYMNDGIDEILVDQKKAFSEVKKFIENFMPEFLPRLKLFSKKESLFEFFNLESQIKESCGKRVRFRGGGFLIFEELETFSLVDVNTGRYMGKNDPEETILKTNLEAAKAIAHQIRLRHLGGIILIDFIDMRDPEARKKVVSALEKELETDKFHPRVFPMSDLGLVQITRRRRRTALSSFVREECSFCEGTGKVRSSGSILNEIFMALEKKSREGKKSLSVLCHPSIKKHFEKEEKAHLQFLKKELALTAQFIAQDSFARETFKIKRS